MKRSIFLFCLYLACQFSAWAIPAKLSFGIVSQRDGQSVSVSLYGDEHFHHYITQDYLPVSKGNDGSFYYLIERNGEIVRSDVLAHDAESRTERELKYVGDSVLGAKGRLAEIWKEKITESWNMLGNKARHRAQPDAKNPSSAFVGAKKGLVILVNFANKEMASKNAQQQFDRMFNEVGYHENNHIGSVHDYFYAQSYGKFDLTFDVVGPVTVSENYGYYGSNSGDEDGNDKYPGQMVTEACRLADDYVDFADYDWDGDGEVEQVFIVYAGYGESSGAASNTIWPHKYSLNQCSYRGDGTGPIVLDGVKIDTYACTCELAGTRGTTPNGIGTACHEFSHCLGLPDFYDVGYSGGFGMGSWDLMDAGGHSGPNHNGEVPCGYTAYEKAFVGWLDLTELNGAQRIARMPFIGDEPVAYIIYNENNRNEYYVLENRQNKDWYSYVQTSNNCHGLLVYHVDYDKNAWSRNNVNTNSNHQRMSIIPADNSYGSLQSDGKHKYYSTSAVQLTGDPFPGRSNTTELTNTSHTNVGGKLFNRNSDGTYNMNKPIENIKEEDGLISFDFMGGMFVPSPEVALPTDIRSDRFTANWKIVEDADSYTVELTELGEQGNPEDNIVFSESMDKFVTDASQGDGFEDLASELDQYMDNKGWTGLKVFTSPYGAKLGTSSVNGRLVSPLFRADNGNLTVAVTARSYGSAEGSVTVLLYSGLNEIIGMQEQTLTTVPDEYVISFKDVDPGSYRIELTSTTRCYVKGIALYDGLFTKDNLNDDTTEGDVGLRPLQKRLVTDVTTNYFVFENLIGVDYRYRVKAHIDGASSAWSQFVYLRLPEESGIVPVKSDSINKKVYTLGGLLKGNTHSRGVGIHYDGRTGKKVIEK